MTTPLTLQQIAEIKRQTKSQGTGKGVVARLIATLEARDAALHLYELALKEAEAILGGEYATHYGPMFDMAEAARAAVAASQEGE